MSSILFVLVYGVLFADWNNGESEQKPFEGIRSWFFGMTGSMWTKDQIRKREPDEASPIAKPSS